MTTFFSLWICKRLINNSTRVDVWILQMSYAQAMAVQVLWWLVLSVPSFQKKLSLSSIFPWTPLSSFSHRKEPCSVPKKASGQSASCLLTYQPYPVTNGVSVNITPTAGYIPKPHCKLTLQVGGGAACAHICVCTDARGQHRVFISTTLHLFFLILTLL